MVNFLDIIYIIISFISILYGIYSGSVKLIIGFIFFILSFISTYVIFEPLKEITSEYIASELITNITTIIISYLFSAILCAFIANKIKLLVKDISGGIIDRTSGLLFGAFRAWIICVIISITLLILHKDYAKSENLLELLSLNKKTKLPHWIDNSLLNQNLNITKDYMIEIIGPQKLKDIKIPHSKKDDNKTEESKESYMQIIEKEIKHLKENKIDHKDSSETDK